MPDAVSTSPTVFVTGATDANRVRVIRRIDLNGQPQQRQLAQRSQIPGAKVVRQRRVDALRGVYVAVGQPAPQRLRGDVDQVDLGRAAHHLVGHGFVLLDAGDLGDDIVEAFQGSSTSTEQAGCAERNSGQSTDTRR